MRDNTSYIIIIGLKSSVLSGSAQLHIINYYYYYYYWPNI
jgi:hypothetical protein